MAIASLKIKIMPKSIETDLEALKKAIREAVSKHERVIFHSIEEELIAFGLKALILTLGWPEDIEQEVIEQSLSALEEVESVQVIDYRRSIG